VPFSLIARIAFSGIPQIPNPPIRILSPSLRSLMASAAEEHI